MGVVGDAEVIEFLQHLADHFVMLDHAVGLPPPSRSLLEPGPDVHARGVVPDEKRFVLFNRAIDEFHRRIVELLIDRRHTGGGQRPRILDPLVPSGLAHEWITPRGPYFFRNSGFFG